MCLLHVEANFAFVSGELTVDSTAAPARSQPATSNTQLPADVPGRGSKAAVPRARALCPPSPCGGDGDAWRSGPELVLGPRPLRGPVLGCVLWAQCFPAPGAQSSSLGGARGAEAIGTVSLRPPPLSWSALGEGSPPVPAQPWPTAQDCRAGPGLLRVWLSPWLMRRDGEVVRGTWRSEDAGPPRHTAASCPAHQSTNSPGPAWECVQARRGPGPPPAPRRAPPLRPHGLLPFRGHSC